jgi:hypothetical protein
MEFYVTDEMLVNKENKEAVYKILSTLPRTSLDINGSLDRERARVKKELADIGETKVFESFHP